MNLARNLERSARYFPERPALSEDFGETSYARLNEKANRVATALMGMGICPGDHVALCAPNSGDWLAFYFGVLKAGAVAVTLSDLLKKDELSLLINHCRPKIILTHDEKLNDLDRLRDEGRLEKIISPGGDLTLDRLMSLGSNRFEAVDRERDHTAAILYTGGTTGIPKGVMLTHENINASIQTVVFNERSGEQDRALCFLPLNHVFGQMHIMNAAILSAGCLELMPGFDLERVLDLMKAGRITKLYAVPTIFIRLLARERLEESMGRVRYCFSAAASMALDTIRQWEARTGLPMYEGYGMTEAAPAVAFNHYYRHVIGSVGTEVPGDEIQIRDLKGQWLPRGQHGEICVRGPNIMKGYLNNSQATQDAFWDQGWFRTGDVGYLDEEGYLFIVDRLKDMIITGGENVYSREVEEALYTFEEVHECAVIGTPDVEWGELVTAFIIPASGKRIDEDRMREALKLKISAYKVPKLYRIVEEFPRNQAGKILKRKLRGAVDRGRVSETS